MPVLHLLAWLVIVLGAIDLLAVVSSDRYGRAAGIRLAVFALLLGLVVVNVIH